MFLPRLARILHHPALATALGAILIIVAGVINVLRGVVPKNVGASD